MALPANATIAQHAEMVEARQHREFVVRGANRGDLWRCARYNNGRELGEREIEIVGLENSLTYRIPSDSQCW